MALTRSGEGHPGLQHTDYTAIISTVKLNFERPGSDVRTRRDFFFDEEMTSSSFSLGPTLSSSNDVKPSVTLQTR